MRLDDPRLAALAAATAGGPSAVVSFVEESADHRLFIAAALLEDGRVRHVHRKVFLPTYGLFDERRFFAAGRHAARRAVAAGRRRRARGVRGLLAPLDAAAARARRRADPDQRVVVAGPGPRGDERGGARDGDLVADADADLRAAHDLVRRVLQPGRRRRVDLVLGRLRGHRADRRAGVQRPAVRRGPVLRRTSTSPTSAASASSLPLLRDERPGAASRASWRRLVAERAGLADDSTAERGAADGFDVAIDEAPVR